ncbi:hypothetical protein [Paenibacillus macerans]|uniref:hypothetical protein n=1 Tax=Paenibacillus macerans TaxID=44252 RepID=UPI003D312DEA
MMKNRHFMLGLGCGLIAGALLLQVMLIGQGSGKALYTKEQIQQAAEQVGLKVVEGDQELLTEQEWLERSGQETGLPDDGAAGQPSSPASPQQPDKPKTPDSPAQPDNGEGKPISDANTGKTNSPREPAEPQPVAVEYKIVDGTTLNGVAEGLQLAGVIADKEAFLKTAVAKKINYKVRAGTYTFREGEDYDSIISKITPKASGN